MQGESQVSRLAAPLVNPLPRPVTLDKGRKHGQIGAMACEERRIIFDYAEAYKAIYTLCAQKTLRLPPAGNITAMAFKDNDPSTVAVKITNALNGADSRCEYSCDFLAAALMVYCRACDIPLPKRGLKTVDVAGESIALRIMIGTHKG